ncbi:MAG: GNAT family N-acetyltransferase [Hyphomonas sp.]|uniref:GNAT family N-acetyltransferase n=1 Tax=Hyphomonas sp. TaxID=87 RepID=UPI00352742AA
MERPPNGYAISPAMLDDITALIEVDLAAGQLFAPTGLIASEALGDHVPPVVFEQAISVGDVLKAHVADGPAVGFSLVSRRGGTLYLDQISVHPDHGRRGLGAALIHQVFQLARRRKMRRVTLSTFRDVPWNGPFYRRLGFRELQRRELADWMLDLERVQAASLDVSQRCFMMRKIGWL